MQALARPEWLVEIDATAVIPDENRNEAENMTFSIVGRCAETGQFGMAVSSSSRQWRRAVPMPAPVLVLWPARMY